MAASVFLPWASRVAFPFAKAGPEASRKVTSGYAKGASGMPPPYNGRVETSWEILIRLHIPVQLFSCGALFMDSVPQKRRILP